MLPFLAGVGFLFGFCVGVAPSEPMRWDRSWRDTALATLPLAVVTVVDGLWAWSLTLLAGGVAGFALGRGVRAARNCPISPPGTLS